MKGPTPIGLTQRLTRVEPHGERRDSLALDWYPFLQALGRPWLALPNEPEMAVDLCARFDLGGLILTGGEDIGLYSERDQTEAALLDWTRQTSRPVIGVCRGFQFIRHWLGGRNLPVDPIVHRATTHEIEIEGQGRRVVSSFHNYAPELTGAVEDSLRPLARCLADGADEAAVGPGLLGLMWHPEREAEPKAFDLKLFHQHLK